MPPWKFQNRCVHWTKEAKKHEPVNVKSIRASPIAVFCWQLNEPRADACENSYRRAFRVRLCAYFLTIMKSAVIIVFHLQRTPQNRQTNNRTVLYEHVHKNSMLGIHWSQKSTVISTMITVLRNLVVQHWPTRQRFHNPRLHKVRENPEHSRTRILYDTNKCCHVTTHNVW